MVRSFKTNPKPSEADRVKLLSSVYENARTPEEAASAFAAESTATENAFRLSCFDAAQIRRNYCESPSGSGDAPATRLTVSCDTPDYQVIEITPPTGDSNAWRVRYDRRGTTGTWEVTPSLRAKSVSGGSCHFNWQ